MSLRWRCSEGHEWAQVDPPGSFPADTSGSCPICNSKSVEPINTPTGHAALTVTGCQPETVAGGTEPKDEKAAGAEPAAELHLQATLCGPSPEVARSASTVDFATTDENQTVAGPAEVAAGGDWPSIKGYEIQGILGRGGMGIVYRARQQQLDRPVALKMILAGTHAAPEELTRFRIEAEAAGRLQHPNIVQIYEVDQSDGRPFLSLEFVGGGSLASRLNGTPWAGMQAARLVETLARAIQFAHERGIIHRDLKPANVLLTEDGTPKVTDFGLAKRLDRDQGHTRTGTIMGTPSYMAPEQAGGRGKEIGPHTDVYALGAILYELLTGRPPFKAETPLDTIYQVLDQEPAPPRLLNAGVDRNLEAICLKCLDKEAKHRYPSGQSLAEDLSRYLQGEPTSIRGVNVIDHILRTLDRSQHDYEFRSWANMLLIFAVLMFAEHLVVFLVKEADLERPGVWIQTARILQFGLMALVFWRSRPHGLLPRTAAERQLWSIWLGYLLGGFVAWLIYRKLSQGGQLNDEFALYPIRAVLAGLAFFAMGGSYWGRCYLFGLTFFALAAAMPFRLSLAPLMFGLLWSAILLGLGLRLGWLARQHQALESSRQERK